jgi:hypothetical protein
MRASVLTIAALGAACSSPPPDPALVVPAPNPTADAIDARSYEARAVVRARRDAAIAAGQTPATGNPEAAMRWRLERWRDENGRYDVALLEAARAQREANAAHHAAIDDAGIGRFGWVERGPSNIGGRTRSLVFDPNTPGTMFAGAVGGGVWRSTNGGAAWTQVDDRMGNLAVNALALVPGTPPVLYAGTGEGFYNGDAILGQGIYKSVDGGVSFQRLAATAGWGYVNRIAVSPADPNVVLAATRSPGGIHRSTDGGATWTLVRSATACMQVVFDPNDAQRLVADVYESSQHRVVRSTNGGLTWTNAASGLTGQSGIGGRIELAYAASAPGTVYASCGTGGGQIWRSTDGGANWTQRSSGSGTGASWYYNTLWVDPTDANLLVTGAYHLYRSTDGGSTLAQISNGYINTSQPHPDQHQVLADPGFDGAANRRVWITNDGGIYTTSDIRSASTSGGWQRREQSYRASQFYGAAGDGSSGRITGGTQDNGHLTLQSGSNTASLTFGGDGGFAAIDWQNPNYIYGEYVYAQVHRSTNGGTSANYIDAGIGEAGSAANFIAPLLLDPNDARRLLVGAASLWRTNDARAASVAWTAIKPAVGSNIAAIAVAPGNPNVVWVGHNDGRIYRTTNGTAATPTWLVVDDNAGTDPLPDRYVQRIVIDRTTATTAFVGLGGFSPDNLWRTTNAGASFVDLTGSGVSGLPNAPVNGIAQHPSLADRLYVGTDVGVFASQNGGATWSTSNDGPADVSVDEVVFLHGSTTLLAATHGRGLWTIAIREPTVAPLGAGCPGTRGAPVLSATLPRLGAATTLTCVNLVPNQFGWLVVGFSTTNWNGQPLPLDLAGLGMPGCIAHCSIDLSVAGFQTNGVLQTQLTLSADPATLGTSFHAQALGLDPAANALGGVVSNALTLTTGN